MNNYKIAVLAAISALFLFTPSVLFAIADSSHAERLELLKKLDMLDALDFQDAVHAANVCIKKHDFKCANAQFDKAEKRASSEEQHDRLASARNSLKKEIELVKLAEQKRAIEREIREEKARFKKRQRELARQREIEEQRAREEREKQRAASILIGAVVGGAAVYHGADSQTGVDLMEATSSGAYGMMSGDHEALRDYETKMASLNQRLEQKRAEEQALFEERLRRQQEAERREREAERRELAERRAAAQEQYAQANSRAAPQQQSAGAERTAAAREQAGRAERLAAAREQKRAEAEAERARKKRAYEAEKMAAVEAARQKVAAQRRGNAPSVASSAGAPSGTGDALRNNGNNTFELARYEPAGNGYVWENIIVKGGCRPDVAANAPGTGGKFVKCHLRLNRTSTVVGYKYQGNIYPHQPGEAKWPWMHELVRVSGDLYESGRKAASFQERIGALTGIDLPSIAASGDRFNEGDFEFRNLKVLPEESSSNNQQIQSYLDKR